MEGMVNTYIYNEWIQHILFISIGVNYTFAGPGRKVVPT